MEKLQLKHLAPYLPYDVMIHSKYSNSDSFSIFKINYKNYNSILTHDSRKLILRPLSDLEEMEGLFTGLSQNDIAEIFHVSKISKVRPSYISMNTYLWLLKHHFDVFGLIEKGLAIDKNKL